MSNLRIKIECTPQELQKAQMLRFEVFYSEINKNPASVHPEGIDVDPFDPYCGHIIVIDDDSGKVVGTYRMMLDAAAREHIGFYSETQFNLGPVKKLEGIKLEVGRACVHKDYRDGYVLNLLWRGIVQYAVAHEVRYIFGCANIMTSDAGRISEYFCAFKKLGLFHDLQVTAKDKNHMIAVNEDLKIESAQKLYHRLPTLFKGYMNVGLKICSYPIADEFGTAVFFTLLDIQNMNQVYKKRFFGGYLSSPAEKIS